MVKRTASVVNNIGNTHFKQGQGIMMNGIWYYILNDGELNKNKSALKEHLAFQ